MSSTNLSQLPIQQQQQQPQPQNVKINTPPQYNPSVDAINNGNGNGNGNGSSVGGMPRMGPHAGELSRNDNFRTQHSANDGNDAIEQTQLQNIINGVKMAEQTGQTNLPTQYIGMQTSHITQDNHTIPNHVPETTPQQHIQQQQHYDQGIQQLLNNVKQRKHKTKREMLIDEIQKPLFVAVFIMFSHLPIIQKLLHKHLTFFYHSSGNMNTYGLIIISLFFSSLYYFSNKFIEYLSEE